MEKAAKRLEAVKICNARLQYCRICGKVMKDENAFCVERYLPNAKQIYDTRCTYYCMDCVKTPKEVMYEVDTDSYEKGVRGLDKPTDVVKKMTKEEAKKFYNLP